MSNSLDERVAESSFIFVGEPVRVYFVDKEFKEVPYENSAAEYEGRLRRAQLEIKILKVLWSAQAQERQIINLPLLTSKESHGGQQSGYHEQVAKYVGRQGIWLGSISTVNGESKPDGSEYKAHKISLPIELFTPKIWFSKSGLVANPMPVNDMKDIIESIQRVKIK